ncbi:hypothetical protein [Cupriavidus basilensis]|uniref:hypothetical protein n=1 Tax=Cupriavidus basilensis TaxID=68895 RepID=UPI0039F6D3B3
MKKQLLRLGAILLAIGGPAISHAANLPPLAALLDCKGEASGVAAYVDALEDGGLRGWTKNDELSGFASAVYRTPKPVSVAGLPTTDVRFGDYQLGNYTAYGITSATDVNAVASQLGLRGVAGRGLARESARGAWIVAREYKGRVELGCEYPNPRLGGQKGAPAR